MFNNGRLRITPIILAITVLISLWAELDPFLKLKLAIRVTSGLDSQLPALLTYGFVHGGFLHLALNMLAFHYLANAVEYFRGRFYFLGIYVLTILISGLGAHMYYSMSHARVEYLVGASGGIFGLFGCLAYLIIMKKGVPGSKRELIQNLILNLMISFLPGISLAAHVAGFVSGWALAFIFEHFNRRAF